MRSARPSRSTASVADHRHPPCRVPVASLDADVWEPHPTRRGVRGGETWFVVGRLRPNVTVDQAQAEMSAIARRLDEQVPAAEGTGASASFR